LSLNSREEMEEERRLFYVALTRAEKKATLSYALTRYRWGQLSYCEPSRFIEEIDGEFLEYPVQERTSARPTPRGIDFSQERAGFGGGGRLQAPPTSQKPKEATLFGNEPKSPVLPPSNFKKVTNVPSGGSTGSLDANIVVGSEVIHEKFGKGKVVNMEGEAPDIKATIYFPTAGQKQLLLKFAKLQVIS
jgi:DNA helicase II / ATP-dependent DNA helicase PcrA